MLRIDDLTVSLTRPREGWTTFFRRRRPCKVLSGLSLELTAGQITVVLGRSGSGKTTLLRAMAGLLPIDSGQVSLSGRSLAGLPPHRRGIHLLFQSGNCYDHWSVRDHLRYDRRSQKRPPRTPVANAQHARNDSLSIDDILDETGLVAFADRYPHELSGGMRQRLGIARAMASDRPVVLLDEPLVHLDSQAKWQLLPLIERLRQLGKAICYVTHDLDDASLLADRIAILARGRIVRCDDFASIWRDPRSAEAAALTSQLPLQAIAAPGGGLVRAEQLELSDQLPKAAAGIFTVKARMIDRRWLAGRSLWTVELEGRRIQSLGCYPIDRYAIDQLVYVTAPRSAIVTEGSLANGC